MYRVQRAIPLFAAVVLIAGGAVVSLLRPAPQEAPKPPNVVIILVDTLRANYLGMHGHEPETAPFLARIARDAAVFDKAYSTSSWTAPSTASVFTSLYPHQHGVVQGFYAHKDLMLAANMRGDTATIPLNGMSAELTTLTELLKQQGYATFGLAANRNIEEELGFTQGFDRFFQENDRVAEDMYRMLRDWKRDMEKARPYFLYLHLMDPHMPYLAHSPHFERYRALFPEDELRAQYLSEIRHTDEWIERIFKMFAMDENTLVVFLTDHGEEFDDHGNREHGPWLYDELQHVLMMFYGPELGVQPDRFGMNVSLIDVLPTIADFVGAATPDYAEGTSLWTLISGMGEGAPEGGWESRMLLGHRILPRPPYFTSWDVIQGPWKYIEHVNRAPELYDRAADPAEQKNVATEHPERAAALAARIAAAREASNTFASPTTQVPMDEELRQQLESLGYVESP